MMRYLKTYEAWKPLIEIRSKDGSVLRYKEEWKTPRSKERAIITNYLEDIFQDLKDDRYRIMSGGWMAGDYAPYIWISSRRRREGFDTEVVSDYIERAKDYLESIGFVTDLEKMSVGQSNEQWYFYFDKAKTDVKVTESVEFDIEDLKDRFLDLSDDEYSIRVSQIKDKPIDFTHFKRIHYEDIGDFYSSEVDSDMIEVQISKRDMNTITYKDFNLSDVRETIDTAIDMLFDMGYRVDSYYVDAVGDLRNTDFYYVDLDDAPQRVTKLTIYFTEIK